MSFPNFFDEAPVVRVRDPLAQLLGASADGIIDYRYADAVRLAGHSCPTVVGAFLTGRAALAALYPDTLPERGGVTVQMPAPEHDGTSGVIAQVLTLLTGAAGGGGFKGLGGRFARNSLLDFASASGANGGAVHFKRLDTGTAVAVSFNAGTVPMDAAQQKRIMAVLQGYADTEVLAAFAEAWQDRVRRLLLEHADDPETIHVTELVTGGNAA
ncbi:hypothetical protein [Nitrosococcus oceani]|uniref:hypothetical protein n=1 Tax=Nitrosococcus oceani TaxID=1229 RepID=UPI0004E87B5A|nr:hypothetical protein [Nitrosococcus oceani]KFI22556.1 hypothetical protein HW44_08985 [Nitrosococcus oceani]